MQTADEIIDQMIELAAVKFHIGHRPYIKEAMQIFARQACKHQRIICHDEAHNPKITPPEVSGAILNAPLPPLK